MANKLSHAFQLHRKQTIAMKTLLASAVLCFGIASASATGVADYAATYKGTGDVLYLGEVYPSSITMKVGPNGLATMTQTFNWSLGPVSFSFSGFVSANGDIVLKTASGDKVVGGVIRGKTLGSRVSGLRMTMGADPRPFSLLRK
jgi:hypothetical protein